MRGRNSAKTSDSLRRDHSVRMRRYRRCQPDLGAVGGVGALGTVYIVAIFSHFSCLL